MNRPFALLALLQLFCAAPMFGADHFLTIGGGGSPNNNQASLERNVVFFRNTLADCGLAAAPHQVFFSCGVEKMRDIQFLDSKANPPRANLLLSRLFSSDESLYQDYRAHDLPDLSGPSNRASLTQWFSTRGQQLGDGDRLFVYFTGHGSGGGGKQPRNTTMDLWFDGGMTVKEFNTLLEKLNPKVQVVLIMVQCHSGGFGDVIFKGAEAGPALNEPVRCGFFATWFDRLAAGCTPDTAEENYQDYTTFFFAALAGKSRTGQPINRPDFNHDGQTSLAEAHAYVMLTSDTIDIPVCTSDVLLRQFSKSNNSKATGLLTPSSKFDDLLKVATPEHRAVLEGLSKQLALEGEDRSAAARMLADVIDKQRKAIDGPAAPAQGGHNHGGGGRKSELDMLRNQIRNRVQLRWPEINNPYNPVIVDLLAKNPNDLVKMIESDPVYAKWNELFEQNDAKEDKSFALERRWVKCQRFLYVAESVALEANLGKFAAPEVMKQFESLRAAENGAFGNSGHAISN